MGVDNNGILFLGLPEDEVDTSVLRLDSKMLEDEGLEEALFWAQGVSISAQRTNDDDMLVGFHLGNSGSYGCIEIDDLSGKIEEYTREFTNIFNIEPKVWLMNRQW